MQVLVWDEHDDCYKSVTLYVIDFKRGAPPGTPAETRPLEEIQLPKGQMLLGVIKGKKGE
jgi:hypothetical protein